MLPQQNQPSPKYDHICVNLLLILHQKINIINQLLLIRKYNFCKSMGKSWSDTVQLGQLEIKNRVVLSALTRVRCQLDGVPTDLVVEYYAQRAGAGLLLTEAAAVSKRGNGYPGQGALWNKEQAQGWKKVVDRVHQKGGIIFIQAFHAGRVTHPNFTGGLEPWAPSAIQNREKIAILGNADYPVPKEMTLEDIQTVKKEFQASFVLAKEAGFDGIQIHGAFGYIIDQFLRTFTNKRTDHYGGSAENRSRLALELVDLALKHFKPHQIGIKLSPTSRIQDMFDENPVQTYTYLIKQLSRRKIGFLELAESAHENTYGAREFHTIKPKDQIQEVCKTFRPHFNGVIIGNYGFTPETGLSAIKEGNCEAISFGKSYISHPDLAERIIKGLPLDNKLDFKTLYWDQKSDKSVGYTDYPFYKEK